MSKKIPAYLLSYIVTIGIVASIFILVPTDNTDFLFFRSVIILFATVLLLKYFVYMLVSPWNDVAVAYRDYQRKKANVEVYAPTVSVIIPAWNEQDGVVTTIETVLKSTYTNTEIIVVNNASTDHTEQNIKTLIQRYNAAPAPFAKKMKIVYLKETMPGKGYALNRGIQASKGEIIISIDADCSVTPRAIEHFVQCFADKEVKAAVGNVKIGNTKNLIGVVQHLEFLFSFYFKKGDSVFGSIYIIGGAAGAFRKEVLKKLHGYNVLNITEDIDLSMRIQNSGLKIVYAQDAIVYTEGAVDVPSLINQRIRWKRGRLETLLAHRQLFFSLKKGHNKILSWLVLPLSIFGEIQLSFELFFILFLFIYSYVTQDYSSFISGIVIVSSMFMVQMMSDMKNVQKRKLLFLAPIGWALLYVSTYIEFRALINTFIGLVRGEQVKWQKWDRQGVFVTSVEGGAEPATLK